VTADGCTRTDHRRPDDRPTGCGWGCLNYDVAMSQGAQKRAGSSASGDGAERRRLETELREAGRLLAAGDAVAAAARLRGIVARGVLRPGHEADARYLLGRALGACGDRVGMTREWDLVLRLDAAASPPPLMPEDEFESVAEAALAELPRALLDELRNVAVLVADRPSAEMVAGGIDPRVLGLYHGVPMTRRSTSFGAPYADTIYLFRANLERVCATRAALAERIRVTVLHETAHYFGYTERQLRRMGLA
jgi:predicted Zn-dependent protease with MMP-like domain